MRCVREETDTAANFLLARYPELAAIGKNDREPGIVHRLDTDTSGVLLAARTAAAFRMVRQQFAAHQVKKEYLAVVHGDVAAAGEVRTADCARPAQPAQDARLRRPRAGSRVPARR